MHGSILHDPCTYSDALTYICFHPLGIDANATIHTDDSGEDVATVHRSSCEETAPGTPRSRSREARSGLTGGLQITSLVIPLFQSLPAKQSQQHEHTSQTTSTKPHHQPQKWSPNPPSSRRPLLTSRTSPRPPPTMSFSRYGFVSNPHED